MKVDYYAIGVNLIREYKDIDLINNILEELQDLGMLNSNGKELRKDFWQEWIEDDK